MAPAPPTDGSSPIAPDDREVRSRSGRAARRFAPLAVLISLLSAVAAIEPSFLSPYALNVLADESSVILILATAQTVVILMGGIDLSMAAIASLASVLIALALPAIGSGRHRRGASAHHTDRCRPRLHPHARADSVLYRYARGAGRVVGSGAHHCADHHSGHGRLFRRRLARAQQLSVSRTLSTLRWPPSSFSPWPCACCRSVVMSTRSAWPREPRCSPAFVSGGRRSLASP